MLGRQSMTEIIEISVVAAMDRPAISENERLEFDELVDAAVGDRCVSQHFF